MSSSMFDPKNAQQVATVAQMVDRLEREYKEAKAALAEASAPYGR